MDRARIGRGLLGLGLLLITAAPAARALDPPGLRWEVLPSSFPDAIPPTEFQEAASGPIFGTAVNTTETGLLHSGTGNVDFGLSSARNETVVDAAMILQGGFCFPGPCGSTTVRWLDTATFHAPGIAAGAPGSFTAQLPTLGTLEAFVPNDWPNYAGTVILAGYSILVYVDGVLREAIQPSCTALPDAACVEAGKTRRYYPDPNNPSSFQVTALPSLFPVIPLGPYDFTFGEPLEIEVMAVANTSVFRGINVTGGAPCTGRAVHVVGRPHVGQRRPGGLRQPGPDRRRARRHAERRRLGAGARARPSGVAGDRRPRRDRVRRTPAPLRRG